MNQGRSLIPENFQPINLDTPFIQSIEKEKTHLG